MTMVPPTQAAAHSPVEKFLIVRLGSMGDIIHTLPAVSALRNAFPGAEIGWVLEERWAELLCTLAEPRSGPRSAQRPLVDRLHIVDTKTWRKNLASTQTWERVAASLSELCAPKYQAAVDFQGAVRSALLARWSGAPVVWGFRRPRETIASMFYTRQVIALGTHIVEQNFSLAEAITGFPLSMPAIDFPQDDSATKHCDDWCRAEGISQFILINPGAGWGAKQWPVDRYGQVAAELSKDGVKSVVNFGPGEEDLARVVVARSEGGAVAVGCSLAELIALTRRASLFIGGDTGPMHLAAALRVPVVAIFGPTNPARNGPYGNRNIVLRSGLSPTTHARRSQPDPGLLEITPHDVLNAARTLLRGNCG